MRYMTAGVLGTISDPEDSGLQMQLEIDLKKRLVAMMCGNLPDGGNPNGSLSATVTWHKSNYWNPDPPAGEVRLDVHLDVDQMGNSLYRLSVLNRASAALSQFFNEQSTLNRLYGG